MNRRSAASAGRKQLPGVIEEFWMGQRHFFYSLNHLIDSDWSHVNADCLRLLQKLWVAMRGHEGLSQRSPTISRNSRWGRVRPCHRERCFGKFDQRTPSLKERCPIV